MAAIASRPWLRVSLGAHRVVLDGELDMATAPCLPGPDEVLAALDHPTLEVDVGALTFVDVVGLRQLRAFEDDLRRAGITVGRRGHSRCLHDLEALLPALVGELGRPEPRGMGFRYSGPATRRRRSAASPTLEAAERRTTDTP